MIRICVATSLWLVFLAQLALAEDEFESPPIEYSLSTPDNRVSQLQTNLTLQKAKLTNKPRVGYLPALLKHLNVDPATQMLVFSKTSMQRDRISPRTPRAIYFNDDTYVGYCHAGDMIEIAATDPKLGPVFYTLDQKNEAQAALTRQTHSCLQCHGATQTDGIPGFLVRSLFVARSGLPILSEGSHRVDHTTPIENRWGGWYVSGTHGAQRHLGNLVVLDRNAPRPWKNEEGQNVTDFGKRFSTRHYLTPHSDLIALMVFEHQTFVHNLLTRANFAARQALHYEAGLNQALGEPQANRLESTTRRIENAGEKLVQGILMVNEAPLAGPISGTSGFVDSFVERGPRDRQGRSLRDLDLTTRLFTYPCSYLIYSREFDELPAAMKKYVARRLQEALKGQGGAAYSHLSASDRESIAQIISETKPDLWEASTPSVNAANRHEAP